MFKVKYFCLFSFLLSLLLLILPNCNKSKDENQKVLITASKKIPRYMKAKRYEYKFGTIDSVGVLSSESKYDSIGNELELIDYIKGTIFRKYVCRYDSLNRIIEKVEYNSSGNILQKISTLYDTEGNISEEIYKTGKDLDYIELVTENKTIKYYYTAGKLFRKAETKRKNTKIIEEIEYDSLGNKVKDYSAEDGKRRLLTEYIYDNENNLIETISYYYYGDLRKFICKYDKNENAIEMQQYTKDNKLSFYKYLLYNEGNHLIEQKAFNSIDEPGFIIKYFYEYY